MLLQSLIDDLRSMIDQTKEVIVTSVSARLTMLYWHSDSQRNFEWPASSIREGNSLNIVEILSC